MAKKEDGTEVVETQGAPPPAPPTDPPAPTEPTAEAVADAVEPAADPDAVFEAIADKVLQRIDARLAGKTKPPQPSGQPVPQSADPTVRAIAQELQTLRGELQQEREKAMLEQKKAAAVDIVSKFPFLYNTETKTFAFKIDGTAEDMYADAKRIVEAAGAMAGVQLKEYEQKLTSLSGMGTPIVTVDELVEELEKAREAKDANRVFAIRSELSRRRNRQQQ